MSPDVRMRGFQSRTDVAAVIRLVSDRVHVLEGERASLQQAADRVLDRDVIAACDVPGYDRAAMDGYALRGSETFGADSYSPLEFAVCGEAFPARPFVGEISSGQAVRIMTGAPLPRGADAVVPAESAEATQDSGQTKVRIHEAVAPGRHVGRRGEDIAAGTSLFRQGRRLRPQDVGVLASVGAADVWVTRRPSVAVFITGDELLPCGSKPEGYRIVDSNSVMLQALLARDGAGAIRIEMIPDQRDAIKVAVQQATEDVLLISGGSSVGLEDHAPRILAELGELTVHGVAVRPASPTGVGFLGARPVFLLPGNPVSCLCAYDLFAGLAVRILGGRSPDLPYACSELSLTRKIASMVGRVDYVRVRLENEQLEPLAVSGASNLSSTTRADGFVLVPADLEGYAEGDKVQVYWYGP